MLPVRHATSAQARPFRSPWYHCWVPPPKMMCIGFTVAASRAMRTMSSASMPQISAAASGV